MARTAFDILSEKITKLESHARIVQKKTTELEEQWNKQLTALQRSLDALDRRVAEDAKRLAEWQKSIRPKS